MEDVVSLTTIAIIVLAVIGAATLFSGQLRAVWGSLKEREPAVEPTIAQALDTAEDRRARLLTLLKLIRECDAAGAKGAASKLRTAAGSLVAEEFGGTEP
jgi:hypothetical protein